MLLQLLVLRADCYGVLSYDYASVRGLAYRTLASQQSIGREGGRVLQFAGVVATKYVHRSFWQCLGWDLFVCNESLSLHLRHLIRPVELMVIAHVLGVSLWGCSLAVTKRSLPSCCRSASMVGWNSLLRTLIAHQPYWTSIAMFKWLNVALDSSSDAAAAAGLEAGGEAEDEEGEVEWVEEGEEWEEEEEEEEKVGGVGLQLDLAGAKWVKEEEAEGGEDEEEEVIVEGAQSGEKDAASQVIKAKGWSRAAAGATSTADGPRDGAAVAAPAEGETAGLTRKAAAVMQQEEGVSAGRST